MQKNIYFLKVGPNWSSFLINEQNRSYIDRVFLLWDLSAVFDTLDSRFGSDVQKTQNIQI